MATVGLLRLSLSLLSAVDVLPPIRHLTGRKYTYCVCSSSRAHQPGAGAKMADNLRSLARAGPGLLWPLPL